MARYSHSKLSTFEQCPLMYRFGYIDHLPKPPSGIEAFMGDLVHQTLEDLFRLKLEFDREPTCEAAEQLFLQKWDETYSPDIPIVRRDVTAEDYKNKGLKCLRNFFEMDSCEDFGELVTPELDFHFGLGDNTLTGKIDRIQRRDGKYHIIDYKTSRRDMTQEKADSDRQLALYEIAVRELFPDAEEVVLHWYMLDHTHVVSSTRERAELDALKTAIQLTIDEIESTTDFLPCESNLCDWCDYQDACAEEKARRSIDACEVEPPIEDVVEEYVRLNADCTRMNADLKAAKDRMEEIKGKLLETCAAADAWSVSGTEHMLDVTRTTDLSIPTKGSPARQELNDIVLASGLWPEVSDLNKTAVLKSLKAGGFGELSGEVEGTFEKKESAKLKIRLKE